MDSRKPVGNLAETLNSLLGRKAHITSDWVKSVCDIIKTLPSQKSTRGLSDAKDDDNDGSGSDVSKLKDEIAALTGHINQLNIQRRQVLNDFLDLKGNIRVFCRIRPIKIGENFGRLRPVVPLDSSNVLLKLAENKSKKYSFDKVFHPGSSQDEVFSEIEPVIKSVLDGYNACIFAYGQTGTGKTFTMEGSAEAPGVVPCAIEALFKQAQDSNHAFLISFSMLEIYLGNLKDLLVPNPTKATDPLPPCLSIQTDLKGGIEIDNLVAIQVNDLNQALRLYRLGCHFRSTASTSSNTTSSRSHCMIRIAITCFDAPERRRETNKIWLVDLGGSERMLKTKAWGKRLDEGKAINLSLSALGDVIYALQRKKGHIPYRNSKLTQVLKDSLGDDSKALMLVHISPKEEDLCETICSLNFATRVKSIHLGNKDTSEVTEQKEVAMASLQQKMHEIEDEQLHVRIDIKRLSKKLENLTGTNLASEETLETYHLASKESLTMNRIGDVIAAPSLKLPRFMRPTVCSRSKSETSYQTSEGKKPVPVRRTRPSSHRHRAGSVTFPVKNHSEYNPECSISRSTCLAGLNMKGSADNATEYSQDMSEIDVKIINTRERETVPRTSITQKADTSHDQKKGNKKTNNTDCAKFTKVDNWLCIQKNDPAITGHNHRTKQVLTTPAEKKYSCNAQSKAEKSYEEKMYNNGFMENTAINNGENDRLVTAVGVGRPISEVVTDKPVITLKDLFNDDSSSDFVSVSWTSKVETMIETQDSVDSSLIEDDECDTFSPPDVCSDRLDEHDDKDGGTGMSIIDAVEGIMQCSSGFLLESCRCCNCSDNSSIYSKGDCGVPTSLLEVESCLQGLPTEPGIEDGERQDFDASSQSSIKEKIPNQFQRKCQRALFTKTTNQKNLVLPYDKLQGETQKKGICHALKQKLEVLHASALLGLGFSNLGLEHDFFYGLML